MDSFGEYLRKVRKGRMTQRELAKKIGIGYPYISKMESNIEPPPSEEILVKLANVLEVDIDEMFIQANKIPKDLKKAIIEKPKLLKLVRYIEENDITDFLMDYFEELILQKEEMYWQVFNKSSDKILLIDPETSEIINANNTAIQFYKYPVEEIKKMKITEINILPKEQVFKELKKAKHELRNYFNFTHRLSGGELVPVRVKSVPLIIGKKIYLHSIIREATDSLFTIGEGEPALIEGSIRIKKRGDKILEVTK